MTKLSGVVAGSLMVAAFLPLGSAIGRGQTITPDPTGMFAGLPPQAPDAVRLGVIAATDIQVHVTIRPKTMRCDDLEAHVQILQNGATHTESYACFGVQHPNALTEWSLAEVRNVTTTQSPLTTPRPTTRLRTRCAVSLAWASSSPRQSSWTLRPDYSLVGSATPSNNAMQLTRGGWSRMAAPPSATKSS
jgi:hypothetical protein